MRRLRLLLLATTAIIPFGVLPSLANPLDGIVVAGSANISGSGTSSLIITQSTDKAIIDWNSFDIGTDELTTFALATFPMCIPPAL
jgi:mucin-19